MKQVVKTGILRSLNRALNSISQNIEWRQKYPPTSGSVEMGHLIGLQDGERVIKQEIGRVKKLKAKV